MKDGIPVTSLSRTILDIAVDTSPRTVRRYIQRADDAKQFDLRAMHDLLDRTVGHRGRATVLLALETYEERPVFTRSTLERRFLDLGIETTRVTGLRLDREPALVISSIRGHLARRSGAPLE